MNTMANMPDAPEKSSPGMNANTGPTPQPVVKITTRVCTLEECAGLTLTRGYICRRPLNMVPLAFDYLAHSTLLFDAHTVQQVADMQTDPEIKFTPNAQFMFERLEDRKDPDTGIWRPYYEIREVAIGKPFKLWYQKSGITPEKQRVSQAFYEIDGRSYECFNLDGYRWTKQFRGNLYNVTINDLVELAKKHGQKSYNLAHNTCHDAREEIMRALNVESPPLRLFSRMTNYLRPPVSTFHLSSANATASVSPGEAEVPAETKCRDSEDS